MSLPDSLESLGAAAFLGTGITSIALPDGITVIPEECFAECDSLSQMTIPESVTTLGASAFFGCDSLNEITLPASLENYGDAALAYCQGMQNIYVEAGNANFKSVEGVLYSFDGTVLHCYPAGRTTSYTVEAGTQTVAFAAFAGGKLSQINFTDSVSSILSPP